MTERDRSLTTVYQLVPGQNYRWVAARTPGYVRMHFVGVAHSSPIGWSRADIDLSGSVPGLEAALDHYWPLTTTDEG